MPVERRHLAADMIVTPVVVVAIVVIDVTN